MTRDITTKAALTKYKLDSNPNLTIVRFENDDDWLELRRKGVGGSDIGALMGINPYSSPLKIYKQKVDGIHEDLSNNVFIKKGKALEDLILTNYVRPHFLELGYYAMKPDFMLVNTEEPVLRANVDGIGVNLKDGSNYDENIIIEIKWVSNYAEVNWNKDDDYCGVPASYYAQVQLYMAVTGIKKAYVCALFDKDWEMHYYEIDRNELFIHKLTVIANRFFKECVDMKMPPRVRPEIDKEETVKVVKKILADESPKTEDVETSELVEKFKKVNADIKLLEKLKANLQSKIIDKYNKGFIPDNPNLTVKMSVVNSLRLNTSKLKEEKPDIYNQYCEDTEIVRTIIK